mmetsp:Transcript_13994/g.36129  ORF Transcript_13994/g.36129 Transcript_13994/m.36129 type:complete len:269 (-) Transcript_13994:1616-2422(-)
MSDSDFRAQQSTMVDSLLEEYKGDLDRAVCMVKYFVGDDAISVQIARFSCKEKGVNVPARETTLVDSSLDMPSAVRKALGLSFPVKASKLDIVLVDTIKRVSMLGDAVVAHRKKGREILKEASAMVSGLNVKLRVLVAEFGKPIAEHVNFALVEVLVRALQWRHSTLMRDLLFGFQPIGSIQSTDCLRPIEEPVPQPITRESNVKSFDDAVAHLTKKAKKADEAAVQDQWVVWDKTLAECDKGFCEGPLSRGQVESLFAKIHAWNCKF